MECNNSEPTVFEPCADEVDWSYIPDYVLLHIFAYLPAKTLLNAGLVCTSWYRISRDEFLWKDLFYNNFKVDRKIGIMPGAKSWYSEYKRLSYHVPLVCTEWLKDHTHQVLHVSFSNNGKLFATCSKDGYILVWKSTYPASILYQYDMKLFSWKYTQFSQFNSTDTLLLVSGVHFGTPPSTSGEIAVFSLQDGFPLQCRVINKPYDIFGVWFSEQHLLSGDLRWLGHLVSTSVLWLNKANQESMSEHVPIMSQLYKFYNANASSVRSIMIADCKPSEPESTPSSSKSRRAEEASRRSQNQKGNPPSYNKPSTSRNDDSSDDSLSNAHWPYRPMSDRDRDRRFDYNSPIEYSEDYRINESDEQCLDTFDASSSSESDAEYAEPRNRNRNRNWNRKIQFIDDDDDEEEKEVYAIDPGLSRAERVISDGAGIRPGQDGALVALGGGARSGGGVIRPVAGAARPRPRPADSTGQYGGGGNSSIGPRTRSQARREQQENEEESERSGSVKRKSRLKRAANDYDDSSDSEMEQEDKKNDADDDCEETDEDEDEGDVLLDEDEEKCLIFTTGSKTYTPHQIGFKRIRDMVFPRRSAPGPTLKERIARQRRENDERLRQQQLVNAGGGAMELDWMDYDAVQDRFDKVDHLIDLHGHIIGMGLSPDHRYLYVNSRPWPEGYQISNPLEPPPIAQEIDIHVIDLTTMKRVGTMLRAHKAYTPNTECFFIFLDVSRQYVASGAEDRHGYLWDRHYGACLVKYPHRDVVNAVAFNPCDPAMLVTTSDDYTVKVWRSVHRARKLGACGPSQPRGVRLAPI